RASSSTGCGSSSNAAVRAVRVVLGTPLVTVVVLVHGAWHGAWCWDGVVDALEHNGISVTAVELPLIGLDNDVAAARRAITAAEPAWKSVPSTYVVCSNDGALPPEAQRWMAQRAEEVVEWSTDHSPFVTRPDAVAELVASYV